MAQLPIGTTASGPLATVDPAGTIRPAGVDWDLRWWVASEERWHHPDRERSMRQRLVDDLPIFETPIRVPSGDVVSTTYAYVGRGGGTEISTSLHNASPVPVAVAFALGPCSTIEVRNHDVYVDGAIALRISRTPHVAVAAPTLDELRDRLVTADTVTTGSMSGYVAVVVPLPHGQSCDALVLPGDDPPEPPGAERLAAGWTTQLERGATWVIPEREARRARRATSSVALGAALDGDLAATARHLRAVLHLGWFDEAAEPTERLLAAQRSRGAIGDDATTVEALAGLSAWRLAAVPPSRMEGVTLAVAAASRHVARRSRRLEGAVRVRAREALVEAHRFLHSMGEAQAAVPVPPPSDEVVPAASNDADPALAVVALVEGLVADHDDGIDLLCGWRQEWWGAPIEAADVPTRWGRVSFAVRWHGERPALLWEVQSWDPEHDSVPLLRAPVLDPSWVANARSGDMLLAQVHARPSDAPRVEIDHGSGFAVWDPPTPPRGARAASTEVEDCPSESPVEPGDSFS